MTTKTERLNMRISPTSLAKLRTAASLREQDLTSFVLSSALDLADQVILSENLVELSKGEYQQLRRIVESENISAALAELFAIKNDSED
jgi:uncharacterized protein (DUF1778 family)